MIEDKILKNIYANYDIFYVMVLSAAMVSSYNSELFESDSGKIISFIREAFELDNTFTEECKDCIFGDMMYIGLVSDYHALGNESVNNPAVLEIKGRVLEEINRIESRAYIYPNSRINQNIKSNMKYESFHHIYEPCIRFSMIRQQAVYGDIISSRQLALLYILGIGCEKNVKKAEAHLIRCVYWGDAVSAKLLALLYKQQGNNEKSKVFREVSLYIGDADEKNILSQDELKLTKQAREICTCAIYIKRLIIIPGKCNEIDTAFVDVISNPDIKFAIKIMYIFRYKDMLWKNDAVKLVNKNRIGY